MKTLEFIGITLITILLCLCVCIGCDNIAKQKGAIEVNDANKIITVSTAGTMKSLLGNDYLNITSLKIVGPINGDDIYYLCKMLGASSFSQADWGKLTTLDLSEASIVEGGNWYYRDNSSNNYYTSNNVIGDFMFSGCANLQKIVLPVNVTSIGTSAFSSCSSLTSIDFPKSVTFIGGIAFMGCSAH